MFSAVAKVCSQLVEASQLSQAILWLRCTVIWVLPVQRGRLICHPLLTIHEQLLPVAGTAADPRSTEKR